MSSQSRKRPSTGKSTKRASSTYSQRIAPIATHTNFQGKTLMINPSPSMRSMYSGSEISSPFNEVSMASTLRRSLQGEGFFTPNRGGGSAIFSHGPSGSLDDTAKKALVDDLHDRKMTELHKKLHNKEKECENLRTKNRRLRSTTQSMKNLSLRIDPEFNIATHPANEEERDLKESLLRLVQQTTQTYQILESRCDNLAAIFFQIGQAQKLGLKDRDFGKLKDLIKNLTHSLRESSRMELQLGEKNREIERKNIEISHLKKSNVVLSQKAEGIKAEIQQMRVSLRSSLDNENRYQKELVRDQARLKTADRKIEELEKVLIEITQNRGEDAPSFEKFRGVLSILTKQNQDGKRELQFTKKVLHESDAKIQKMETIINRLSARLEELEDEKNERGERQISEATPRYRKKIITTPGYLVSEAAHQNLNFRLDRIQDRYKDLLVDLIENGCIGFREYFATMSRKEQEDILSFLADQYLSLKDFAERFNWLANLGSIFIRYQTRSELVVGMEAEFSPLISAEHIILWTIGGNNDEMKVILSNGREHGCSIRARHHKRVLQYGETFAGWADMSDTAQRDVYAPLNLDPQNIVLLPCKTKEGKTIGIIEAMAKRDRSFGEDDQYLLYYLGHMVSPILQKLISEEIESIEAKMRDTLMKSFIELTMCKTRPELSRAIKKSANNLFASNNCQFAFVLEDKLITYSEAGDNEEEDKRNEYAIEAGVVGHVASIQKKFIARNITENSKYSPGLDLKSNLSVNCYPVLDKREDFVKTIGVLQIPNKYASEAGSIKNAKIANMGEIMFTHLNEFIVNAAQIVKEFEDLRGQKPKD